MQSQIKRIPDWQLALSLYFKEIQMRRAHAFSTADAISVLVLLASPLKLAQTYKDKRKYQMKTFSIVRYLRGHQSFKILFGFTREKPKACTVYSTVCPRVTSIRFTDKLFLRTPISALTYFTLACLTTKVIVAKSFSVLGNGNEV